MANLGSLVVSLEANMARFTSDMGRAAQQTEQAMGKINAAANMAKGALAAIGIGVSVGAFAALVKGSIDAADHLRDMSQKTGIAVETLNGLAFAAGQAGGNLESMVASAGKLNKSIVEAAGGNKDVGEAFSKLGISVRDANGHLKTADVVMAEVADKFKTYADGPEKATIALRIFGKAGADMIPLLNDGGDAMRENIAYAKQYSGVTQELAEASDNFNDTMGKLAIQQKSFGNAMATAVLPVMQAVANEFLAASEQSEKFSLASNVVRTTLETFVVVGSEVAFTFSQIGTGIGGAIARLDALRQGDFKGFSVIGDMMEADLANAKTKHDAFIANVLDRTPRAVQSVTDGWDDGGPKKAAPMLRAKGDDPTKAILDGKLKSIEAAFASERDTAAFHNQFMDALRASSVVDMQKYEDFKKASIEAGLESSIRAYDAEIAELEKYRAAAGKETERAMADGQIKEKMALKEKARIDASQASAMLELNNAKTRHDLVKKWQAETDAITAQTESNFLGLYRSLQTTTEAENDAFQERIDGLIKFKNDQLANEELGNTAIEREKKRHEEALVAIKAANDLQALGAAASAADEMYNVIKNAGMQQSALAKAFFLVNKAIAVAEIIVATNAAAQKAQLEGGTFAGFALSSIIQAAGYARAAIVAGTAIAAASAEGGYDIPAGTNPVTQLHEKEMVLPKAQADVIRGLAANGGKGGAGVTLHQTLDIHIDARTDRAQVEQLVRGAVKQGNAELTDKLIRARIL
jgi:hypothetical protein